MNKFAVRYLLNLADPLRLERRPDWFKASCTTIMLGVNIDKVYTIMDGVSIGIPNADAENGGGGEGGSRTPSPVRGDGFQDRVT